MNKEVLFYIFILGIGYNGFLRGCLDDRFLWVKVW